MSPARTFAERWVRSIKHECLSKSILFGEASFFAHHLRSGTFAHPAATRDRHPHGDRRKHVFARSAAETAKRNILRLEGVL